MSILRHPLRAFHAFHFNTITAVTAPDRSRRSCTRPAMVVKIIMAVLTAALVFVPTPGSAATFTVTSTGASGPGTLHQAITDANNNPGPDTITFSTDINGIAIFLLGPAGEDANVSGDLDILDGGDLIIQGNGVANTVIDGGGIDRVFHVCPGGSCANTVTFNGVTIQNGRSLGLGGGILNSGATLNVQNSTIGGAAYDESAFSRSTASMFSSSTIWRTCASLSGPMIS